MSLANSVIVIAGPTASGKSSVAMELARFLRAKNQATEILCADSITVYRGFEIGAAKPSAADRAEFPHHLLDIADPLETFTAGDFVRHAQAAIAAIQTRGAIPLLVGGTGFYLRALLRGMASDEEDQEKSKTLRAELEARAEKEGWEALHRELLRQDPGSAATVHANDHYRILRALQAMALFGKPWSELNKEARASDFRYPHTRFFCLDIDREELKKRIEARTQTMLREGLLAEVRQLMASGIPPTAKPLLSVGYKECVETLEEKAAEATLAERIIQSTNKLGKQQRTWFRGEKGVEWLAPPFSQNLLQALGLAATEPFGQK